MIAHLGIALATFIATNIDDLLLLSIYFAGGQFKPKSIVIGQYAGISILIAVSMIGWLAAKLVAPHWISLLGALPLYLGMRGLFALRRNEEEEQEGDMPTAKSRWQFLNITLVTIANGGDNIGVYTPLFATLPAYYVPFYVITWLALTGVWCVAGYMLVKHPKMKRLFSHHGKWILPVFLVLLGLWIMKDFVIWAMDTTS